MKTVIRGFDFHCHVDLHPDPEAIVDRCALERIVTLAVTNTPKAWPQNLEWASRNGYVHAAAGLHPELADDRSAESELLAEQINISRFIGEVGLDGRSRFRKTYERQKQTFSRVLDIVQQLGGRVLSIHSRGASGDVITMIESRTDPNRVMCILHWFSGSISEAHQAALAGCFFSINRTMLSHDRGWKLVQNLPVNRLLTETDSPFTTIGERKSMPWDVTATAANLAQACGLAPADMNLRLLANAQQVLGFAGLELIAAN